MAYFANGTEGMSFEVEECEGCWFQERDGEGCPLMLIQILYNYDQCKPGEKRLREAMNVLIHEERSLGKKCSMRLERADVKGQPDPDQADLFTES